MSPWGWFVAQSRPRRPRLYLFNKNESCEILVSSLEMILMEVIFTTMHYGSMINRLSPLNICIREIWPFAPIFQGNNCFRVKYLKITFTFNIYLGTSWKEAKSAKDSIKILTGWWKDVFQIFETSWKEGTAAKELIKMITDWWKDVFQIFGTSWMLQGFVVLVNENIWEIFALWRGPLLF